MGTEGAVWAVRDANFTDLLWRDRLRDLDEA